MSQKPKRMKPTMGFSIVHKIDGEAEGAPYERRSDAKYTLYKAEEYLGAEDCFRIARVRITEARKEKKK